MIVTTFSKASFWIIAVTNLLFALLGIGVASAALFLAGEPSDTRQSHMRMNIAGLAAPLFEGKRLAQSEDDLFEE